MLKSLATSNPTCSILRSVRSVSRDLERFSCDSIGAPRAQIARLYCDHLRLGGVSYGGASKPPKFSQPQKVMLLLQCNSINANRSTIRTEI